MNTGKSEESSQVPSEPSDDEDRVPKIYARRNTLDLYSIEPNSDHKISSQNSHRDVWKFFKKFQEFLNFLHNFFVMEIFVINYF